MDTRSVAMICSTGKEDEMPRVQLDWIRRSRLVSDAYGLAAAAHGDRRRPSDGRYFLEHVVEVAGLLHDAGFGDELVAVGLLHDSVERGTLTERELRDGMGAGICSLVQTLSEDAGIASFDRRKAGLREQVESGGRLAITVYAADKLSDLRGLRRGIEIYGARLSERLDSSLDAMVAHYRESVEMIESTRPGSVFLTDLRPELESLKAEAGMIHSAAGAKVIEGPLSDRRRTSERTSGCRTSIRRAGVAAET